MNYINSFTRPAKKYSPHARNHHLHSGMILFLKNRELSHPDVRHPLRDLQEYDSSHRSKDTLNPSRDTLYAIRYTSSLASTTHRKMDPLWGRRNPLIFLLPEFSSISKGSSVSQKFTIKSESVKSTSPSGSKSPGEIGCSKARPIASSPQPA